jgi:hypothetical protein
VVKLKSNGVKVQGLGFKVVGSRVKGVGFNFRVTSSGGRVQY